MNTAAHPVPRAWWGLAGLGVVMIFMSLVSLTVGFLLPRPQSDPFGVVLVGTGAAVGFIGGGLLISGVRGRRGIESPPLVSRWGWLLCLGAALVLLAIGLLLPSSAQVAPAFGLLHVSLVALPAGAILMVTTLTAGSNAVLSVREGLLGLAGGALSVLAALPLELLGFVGVGLVVILAAMIFPGGEAAVTDLLALLEQWTTAPPSDAAAVLDLLRSPIILAIVALMLCVVAPLVEELCKTFLIGVFGFRQRPGLATAFLLGLSSGLGFAVLEGVSNGALGLGSGGGWAGGVGVRVLATAMHGLASGLIGLGWGWAWRGRWWALPLTYLLAVLYHGFWNLNVVVAVSGAGLAAPSGQGLGAVLVVGAVAFELLLVAVTSAGLLGIPLFLRRPKAA